MEGQGASSSGGGVPPGQLYYQVKIRAPPHLTRIDFFLINNTNIAATVSFQNSMHLLIV